MIEKCIFPNQLKRMRKEAGLLQLDVARMLGHTSADRISHWEKGLAAPNLVNLFKLAVIYKVPAEQLYAEFYKGVIAELKERQNSLCYSQVIPFNPCKNSEIGTTTCAG